MRFANFVSKKPKLFYMGKLGFIKKLSKELLMRYLVNTTPTPYRRRSGKGEKEERRRKQGKEEEEEQEEEEAG